MDTGDVTSTGSHKIQNVKAVYFGALPTYAARDREQNQEVVINSLSLSLVICFHWIHVSTKIILFIYVIPYVQTLSKKK